MTIEDLKHATIWVRVTTLSKGEPNLTANGLLIPYSGPVAVLNSSEGTPVHRLIVRLRRGTPIQLNFTLDPAQPPVELDGVAYDGFTLTSVVPNTNGSLAPVPDNPNSLLDPNGSRDFTLNFTAKPVGGGKPITATWDPGVDNETPP